MNSFHPGLQDRICRNKQLKSAEIHDEIVVINLARGCYYGLDDISSTIYKRLEQPTPVFSLCRELAREYRADAAVVERDVLALLGAMLDQELIVLVPEAGA